MYRHVSIRHMHDLRPAWTYNANLPYLNSPPDSEEKDSIHPCSRSHSFGSYSPWFPYLLQIKFPLCHNSPRRVSIFDSLKEQTHISSVTPAYFHSVYLHFFKYAQTGDRSWPEQQNPFLQECGNPPSASKSRRPWLPGFTWGNDLGLTESWEKKLVSLRKKCLSCPGLHSWWTDVLVSFVPETFLVLLSSTEV